MAVVTVYLKHPHGVQYDLSNGKSVVLNGYHTKGAEVVADFAVTRNVDADAWAEIEKSHGKSQLFLGGYIVAKEPKAESSAKSEVSEKSAETVTGFEPLTPEPEAAV